MVAAKDEAMSFGPVESELFLDSEMPSLYDMFNDMYGDPPPPKSKKLERNIGLAPGEVKETEQHTARSQRSGREFSLLRRQVKRKQGELKERKAAAMFYVVGRTPLHLALERYDSFDGRQWNHSDEQDVNSPIRVESYNGKPWAYCKQVDASPIHRVVEQHAVKIINLRTNRFPSPPQLMAIHIDKVDREDFYGWTDDSVAYMPVRAHLPQLAVVHLKSLGVNLHSLRTDDFTAQFSQKQLSREPLHRSTADIVARYTESSANGELVSQTVNEWTRNVPRGWRQVEAVVRRLRQEFTLNRQVRTYQDRDDVIAHFLRERQGPDYLFATTAAMMLRDLVYPRRLVTGFYARRDRFDRRAGQTVVLAEDVHVWVEVYVGANTWVAIEPTPGYEHPAEKLTWTQWLVAGIMDLSSWSWRNAAVLLVAAIGLIAIFKPRRDWLAFLATLACNFLGRQSSKARLRWTIWLLEWRAWLVGCQRPSQRTITSY